jgi:hypothetical protein
MRVIYLTLLIFVLFGIGANCRTPTIQPSDPISTPAPPVTAGQSTAVIGAQQ